MRQSIHILLKDVRHLRSEIALFLVAAAIYAWAGSRLPDPMLGPQWLVAVAAVFVIARVIHSEPIPGDDQFWVTRPYSRISLAGAKLLFIVAFVCAPVCAAQIIMIVASGFPFVSEVPGLLWSQVLIFVGSSFIAALAAMTSGTVLFMFAALLLGAAGFIGEFAYPFFLRGSSLYRYPEPFALEWVRQYFALAILALTATFILCRQYRDRATTYSQAAGAVGICLAAAVFLWLPSPLVYAVQSFITGAPSAANAVRVSVDAGLKNRGAVLWRTGDRAASK